MLNPPDISHDQTMVANFIQHFYQQYNTYPNMRVLIRHLEKIWHPSKANSLYLYQIFPEGPIKEASLLAGLPPPRKCL